MNNYQLLIQKLDEFIRKFYLNQLLRGVIYSVAIVLAAFLTISLLENYFYFDSSVRWILLSFFLVVLLFTLVKYIVLPLLHFFKLGKTISHQQAAQIIGTHFQNVQDKLLNVLQLSAIANSELAAHSSQLIIASIDQKISELKPIPFQSAVNLNDNKKYLKYAIVPTLALIAILLIVPSWITKPTKRLLNPTEHFEREAPFEFIILNKNLEVLQQNDITLQLKISGKILPDEVFVNWQNNDYKLQKKSANEFEYKLSNLQKTTAFHFEAAGFKSKEFQIKVISRPMIVGFDLQVNYPSYLGRKNEALKNIGDMEVPEGTTLSWKFNTQNTDNIQIHFSDSSVLKATNENDFSTTKRMMQAASYTLFVSNNEVKNADSITYHINVIPDLYPTISVNEMHDSINKKLIYFVGNAEDDYGLRSIIFHYQITSTENPNASKPLSVNISQTGGKYAQFTHFIDISTLNAKPGDRVNYYFECFDNDGVHGSKSGRTGMMLYQLPTDKELEKQVALNSKSILADLEKALKEAKDLKNQLKQLQEKLLQKKSLSYEEKKQLEELQAKEKQLENRIDNMEQHFEESKNALAEMQQLTPEMQEKMDALKEMMKEMKKDDDSKKLEDMAENMEKMNKEQMMEQLKEQQQNQEQKQKELDRMMSLFKQMQLDQKVQEAIKNLEELAKKQDDLQQKTDENKNADASKNQELKKQQDDLKKEFGDVKKKLDEIAKMDKEGKDQLKMDETKQDQKDIEQEQQNSSDELSQNQNSKSSKSQKSASSKMQSLAKKMQQKQESAEAEQLEMDLRAIRQLLENLVKLSYDQEDLMNDVRTANINNPQYLMMMQRQQKLKEDSKMIEDSLYSLGKTVMQIKKYVTEQMTEINKYHIRSIASLEARSTYQAAGEEQYIMTGANNLALMLTEIMQNMQMQQQSASSKPGSGKCNKPGGMGSGKQGKKNGKQLKDLSQMSKEMQEQLAKMMGEKPGDKPGDKPGNKPGEKPEQKPGGKEMGGGGQSNQESKNGKVSNKEGTSSKEFAEMAAKQAAIRKALQQFDKENNKDGKSKYGNLQQLAKDMERNETDLVNKRLTGEMLRRQQDIVTRLLEAEEAERKQDQDNKRESKTAEDKQQPMPPALKEYLLKRQAELELYKTLPPNLRPYYKQKVEEYFKNIKM
ncbi:MAG: hypothetical protein RJA07_1254 [Bacteroidota bacterium]